MIDGINHYNYTEKEPDMKKGILENFKLYYKIFHAEYCRINNFRKAIQANFFDGLSSALTQLIYAGADIIGYVTKAGPLLSANEFDIHLIPQDFFRILKNRIKESGMFFYDLVPHNIVLIDGTPSLIDLESVYDIKDYKSISKHNAKVKPVELDNFVKELNNNMKKDVVFIPNIDLGNITKRRDRESFKNFVLEVIEDTFLYEVTPTTISLDGDTQTLFTLVLSGYRFVYEDLVVSDSKDYLDVYLYGVKQIDNYDVTFDATSITITFTKSITLKPTDGVVAVDFEIKGKITQIV